ncbi:hypothetical protein [Candidatus Enterovibrio escicola]
MAKKLFNLFQRFTDLAAKTVTLILPSSATNLMTDEFSAFSLVKR